MKIVLRATREECGECALLGNISPTAESLEYQPLRPMRQSRNHGRKAVNPYSNIGQIRAAFPLLAFKSSSKERGE